MTKSQGKAQEWEGWAILLGDKCRLIYIEKNDALMAAQLFGGQILPVLIVPRKLNKRKDLK